MRLFAAITETIGVFWIYGKISLFKMIYYINNVSCAFLTNWGQNDTNTYIYVNF